MNGPKTIGRVKPEADSSLVDDVVQHEEAAEAGTLQPTNARERALNIENQQLRRELSVMTARVSVMSMGGKPGSTAPIGGLYERFKAFEEKTLGTIDMTPEAKLRTLDEMSAAFKSWNEREKAHLAEVEKGTQEILDDGEVSNRGGHAAVPTQRIRDAQGVLLRGSHSSLWTGKQR